LPIAIFVVNAISSQRTGPDYLLTPGFEMREVETTCCLALAGSRDRSFGKLEALESEVSSEKLATLSEADQAMIKEAEHWLKIAINDQYWHKILPKISIPIRLGRLPAESQAFVAVAQRV
jgi:hypothetical protein